MLDHIQFEKQTDSALYLRLKDPSMLEGAVFSRMENDTWALRCMVIDEKKGQLMYTTQNLLPLSIFFKNYTFEKQEGYLFLISVLEKAIAVNRSKPVLLDTDFIYVSPCGDEVYFVVLPLKLEFWMFQKDECQCLVQEFLDQIQCRQCYELPGYMVQFMHHDEFSLPNLVNGLKTLMDAYYPHKWPKSWFCKKKTGFQAARPVHASLYQPDFFGSLSAPADHSRQQRNVMKAEEPDVENVPETPKQTDLSLNRQKLLQEQEADFCIPAESAAVEKKDCITKQLLPVVNQDLMQQPGTGIRMQHEQISFTPVRPDAEQMAEFDQLTRLFEPGSNLNQSHKKDLKDLPASLPRFGGNSDPDFQNTAGVIQPDKTAPRSLHTLRDPDHPQKSQMTIVQPLGQRETGAAGDIGNPAAQNKHSDIKNEEKQKIAAALVNPFQAAMLCRSAEKTVAAVSGSVSGEEENRDSQKRIDVSFPDRQNTPSFQKSAALMPEGSDMIQEVRGSKELKPVFPSAACEPAFPSPGVNTPQYGDHGDPIGQPVSGKAAFSASDQNQTKPDRRTGLIRQPVTAVDPAGQWSASSAISGSDYASSGKIESSGKENSTWTTVPVFSLEAGNDMPTQILDLPVEKWGTLEVQSRSWPLKFEVTSIGRHMSNDIVLNSGAVSSHHARIMKEAGIYYIQDLKSTNKTWVFNQPVSSRLRLREGMVIRFGDVEGVFHEPEV